MARPHLTAGRTHIQRACPQDFRTSKVRMRSIITGDAWLRVIWRELIDSLWEHNGELPLDVGRLADDLGVPRAEMERCLAILGPEDLGFLRLDGGAVSNDRVSRELASEYEFREQQRQRGLRSVEVRRQAPSEPPPADPPPSGGSTGAGRTPNPPAPAPLPAPAPAPAPEPKKGTGAADAARAAFDAFWMQYPKKRGKGGAFAVWRLLTRKEQADALQAVAVFAGAWEGAAADRRQFIVDPERWLKRRRWEDDPREWFRDAASDPERAEAAIANLERDRQRREHEARMEALLAEVDVAVPPLLAAAQSDDDDDLPPDLKAAIEENAAKAAAALRKEERRRA